MKKILVAVDFSKPSEYAAKTANSIAKKTNASIFLIHTLELPSGIIDRGSGSTFSIPSNMLYLDKVKERLRSFREKHFSEDMEVHNAIRFEETFTGILHHAKDNEADLIVMGSKGHSEFEEIVIGSNTEKVVRTSPIPVLAVKSFDKDFSIENIVFASNFEEEQKEVFKKLVTFASIFKSKIHLLKVITASKFLTSKEAKERIDHFISEIPLSDYSVTILNDETIEKGIIHYSRDIDADIVCLCTHGRSGLSHLFTSSVTKLLAKSTQKPLMTYKI